MKYLFFLCFLICVTITLNAQNCDNLPSITLNTQSEVDSFPINYPTVTDFYEIQINGTSITHLDSLIKIELCGFLEIQNTSLLNLNGLENLREAYCMSASTFFFKKGILIKDNALLRNLEGLNNLETTSDFSLINNALLESTRGLNVENWRTVESTYGTGREIYIENNSSLIELKGFDNLTGASKIELINNPILEDISTFNNLTLISNADTKNESKGTCTLLGNPGIISLEAFRNISVRGIFTIERMSGLTSLKELGNLRTRELIIKENTNLKEIQIPSIDYNYSFYWNQYNLTISDNPLLENIGIENFNLFPAGINIQGNYLTITNNPLLKHCNEEYICYTLSGDLLTILSSIKGNAAGCFDTRQIIFQCASNKENGHVYIDKNCNQIMDGTESGLENLIIEGSYGSTLNMFLTRSDGSFGIPWGAPYWIEWNVSVKDYSGLVPYPDHHIYNYQNQENLDFAICIDSLVSDLRAKIVPKKNPSLVEENAYTICVENNGTIPNSGSLTLLLNNESNILNNIEILETDGALSNQNEFKWDFTDLEILNDKCFDFEIKVNATASLTDTLKWELRVNNTTGTLENTPEDNVVELTQTIREISEPTFKVISPNLIDFNQFQSGQDFEFTIEFQNVFDETVNTVVITDTISRAFDLSTFEMISSSHEYFHNVNVNYQTNERVINWFFEDINLPSAEENSLLSKGQIVFKMKNNPDLEQIDSIENKAFVYFDCFEPVSTNNAKVDPILGNDLYLGINRTYLNCSQIMFDLEIQNNGVELTEKTPFRFFLNDTHSTDTYSFVEIDGAVIVGDTLLWEIDELLPTETKRYSILIETENSYYEEATALTATAIIDIQDEIIDNNGQELIIGAYKPESLLITNQEDLDNCYCLREIGLLRIEDDNSLNDPIINMDSLNRLESVTRQLNITDTELLTNIIGFNHLTYCRDLLISDNDKLDTLMGFENLLEAEIISISYNDELSYLARFKNLLEVEGISVRNNDKLTYLVGFENLLEAESISISYNDELNYLSGFDKLIDLSEYFYLSSCNKMSSISDFNPPLQNFPNNLRIIDCEDLNTCNSSFVCNAIKQDSLVDINISNNSEGCDNLSQVQLACNDLHNLELNLTKNRLDCSRIEFNINIENLDQYDSDEILLKFNINESSSLNTYSFEELAGASLSGDTLNWIINSLEASATRNFSIVLDIENSFYADAASLVATANIVYPSNNLSSDTKEVVLGDFQPSFLNINSQSLLDNCYCLKNVSGSLLIQDTSLIDPIVNLDSLKNLEYASILDMHSCKVLEEVNGLSNLKEVDRLSISFNDFLKSIRGFESLEILHNTLAIESNPVLADIQYFNPPILSAPQFFNLKQNSNLSVCNSTFLCSLVEDGNGDITIENNVEGCNTLEEVAISCSSSVSENHLSTYKIYPNPVSEKLFMHGAENYSIALNIKLTNINGTLLHREKEIEPSNWSLDISDYPQGIYFLTIQTEEGSITKKVVIGN